jgi:MFS family permease
MSELPPTSWLNRTVIGAGLTSLLSDVAYEMATSLLAGFIVLLNIPQWFLGLIEGTGDALANFVKLGVGYYSDQIGKRKAIVVSGYALTGVSISLFAFAFGWPLILLGKSLAWIGKGLRGPLRDAILADSVPPQAIGRAFGFHRAGDTIGAVLGPIIGAILIASIPVSVFDAVAAPHRIAFLLTLLPGVGAALVFLLMVREQRFTPRPALRFRESLAELPAQFRRYLLAVGIFGLGDFNHSLLILASIGLLTPEHGREFAIVLGPILYATRNTWQALASFPIGALSDRIGRRGLLVAGYVLGSIVMLGFAAAYAFDWTSVPYIATLFVLAGIYIAVQEALEGAMTADLNPDKTRRGTAYGILGFVNGIGDFAASFIVGLLLAWQPEIAFIYAAGWMILGAGAMARVRPLDSRVA